MVNEGAKILEEGMAQRASDIDVVWINGYGWPLYTGGPMFWADTVGLDNVVARSEESIICRLRNCWKKKLLQAASLTDRVAAVDQERYICQLKL